MRDVDALDGSAVLPRRELLVDVDGHGDAEVGERLAEAVAQVLHVGGADDRLVLDERGVRPGGVGAARQVAHRVDGLAQLRDVRGADRRQRLVEVLAVLVVCVGDDGRV